MIEQHSLIYIDTSTYLALLLGENNFENIQKKIEKYTLCSSTFLLIESERNLIRLCREKIISSDNYVKLYARLQSDIEIFILKDLTNDLCINGVFPAIKTPRSSDLVHLRTAHWFYTNNYLAGFLTLDQHQREAAMELKLPIIKI